MITFEPDVPWEVGQKVMFHYGKDKPSVWMVITGLEHSDDKMETQYTFRRADITEPLGLLLRGMGQ